jgi:uncharacterized RDD family membrane protein YckC
MASFQGTRNDNVEKLLDRIIAEVDKEEQPVRYATFVQRVIARLIDMAVMLGITLSINFIAIHYIRKSNIYNADYVIDQFMPFAEYGLPIILWALFYSPLLEATGGTIGKRMVGIKLVDEDTGGEAPFRNFFLRSWVYLVFIVLAMIPAVLSCLAYFVSDKKQTWHDKLASVICVRK